MLQENIGNLTLRLSGIGARQERSGVVLWFSKAWDRGEATEARKAPPLCGFLLENDERIQEGSDKGAANNKEWNASTVLTGDESNLPLLGNLPRGPENPQQTKPKRRRRRNWAALSFAVVDGRKKPALACGHVANLQASCFF
ncbi:hypothetical protein BHE74_00012393 [Ensete ventricosum]|nr:hypothetical protein BHE74_00012393 [Ensete ventricosum]